MSTVSTSTIPKEVILRILKSQQEAREGKILQGDIDDLIKQL